MIGTQVDRYCSQPIELIENYEAAIADTTQVWECHHKLEIQGQFTNSTELLKKCGLYWHRPARELIFLTKHAHRLLHKDTVINNVMQHINALSYEQKRARALFMHAKTTHEQLVRGGIVGGAKTGKMPWWNDGVVNTRAIDCPGPEWKPGMVSRKKHNQ